MRQDWLGEEAVWMAPPPPSTDTSARALIDQWNPAKSFAWLRARHPAWLDPKVQDFQARSAFRGLGINHTDLSNAWHRRHNPDWEALTRPIPALPVRAGEDWPEVALEMESSAAGVLAVLVAMGWNAFKPFLPEPGQPMERPEKVRPLWAVELLMGQVGATRIPSVWRQALVDQMFRSAHCPSLEVLASRQVCKFKSAPPIPWAQACARHQEWVGMRALLDHGLADQMTTPDGRCVSVLCPEETAQIGLRAHFLSRVLPPPSPSRRRPRV